MTIEATSECQFAGPDRFLADPSDTILVTGANGYVGSAVVRMLQEYRFERIRCLIRRSKSRTLEDLLGKSSGADLQIVIGNLLSPADCTKALEGVSVIYHLAAGVEKSYAGCFLNSVVTTRNLLDAAVRQRGLRRFVNVSSIAVYTNEAIPRGGLLDETCQFDTNMVERYEPYTYAKAKQDELVLQYAREHELPYVIVRPSVVFGPGKAKITDRIGTSTFGAFVHLGLGNRIPLTYIDNCAEAIVLAGLTRSVDGQVFNIVDDDLPTSRQFLRQYKREVRAFLSIPVPYPLWYRFCHLWEAYSKWSHGQLPPVFNRRTCSVYWKGNRYSNQKAKELLEWKPRVRMQDALDRFFAYMREAGNSKK